MSQMFLCLRSWTFLKFEISRCSSAPAALILGWQNVLSTYGSDLPGFLHLHFFCIFCICVPSFSFSLLLLWSLYLLPLLPLLLLIFVISNVYLWIGFARSLSEQIIFSRETITSWEANVEAQPEC